MRAETVIVGLLLLVIVYLGWLVSAYSAAWP